MPTVDLSATPRALPQNSVLGLLHLDHTWFDYKGPKLFVAQNSVGQYFVVLAVDQDELSITYIYFPVSVQQREALHASQLVLREALLGSTEGCWSYQVGGQHTGVLQYRDPASLPQEWLPQEQAFINQDKSALQPE